MDVASEKNNIAPGLLQAWPAPPTAWPRATTTNPTDAFQQPQGLGQYGWRRVRQLRRVDLQFVIALLPFWVHGYIHSLPGNFLQIFI